MRKLFLITLLIFTLTPISAFGAENVLPQKFNSKLIELEFSEPQDTSPTNKPPVESNSPQSFEPSFTEADAENLQPQDFSNSSVPLSLEQPETLAPIDVQGFKDKYGIEIIDKVGYLKQSNSLKAQFLQTLDFTLSLFGENVVNKVVDHYSSIGIKFAISIDNPAEQDIEEGILAYAFQDGETKTAGVVLYTPYNSLGGGVSVDAIAHEFGHIIHYILDYEFGEQKLKNEYTKLNKGIPYDDTILPEEQYIFPNEYGSTDYYEDFASMFELLAYRPYEMAGKFFSSKYFVLLYKSRIIKQFAESYFGDFGEIFEPIFIL